MRKEIAKYTRSPTKKAERSMSTMKVAAVLAGSAMSIAAFAADKGWYGTGSLGQTTFNNAAVANDSAALTGTVPPSVSVPTTSDKNKSHGYTIGAGYMFNQNFGIEGGWADLGKATAIGHLDVNGIPVGFYDSQTEFKASGLFVSGVAMYPVRNDLSVFAKLGLIDATVKSTASVTLTTPPVVASMNSVSTSSTKWTPLYGVGVQYNVYKQWEVRGEYEKFQKLGDKNKTGQFDVSMVSIGAVYKFK